MWSEEHRSHINPVIDFDKETTWSGIKVCSINIIFYMVYIDVALLIHFFKWLQRKFDPQFC